MHIEKILFLDIETVSQTEHYQELGEQLAHLWEDKAATLRRRIPERYETMDEQTAYENGAAIFAEFGKIVCIAAGFIFKKDGRNHFRVKSFTGDDERQLLIDFCALLSQFGSSGAINLCGHNIKEFDIPYICRRLLIHLLPLPALLNVGNKKPWEVPFLDTLEMWRFGDYKNFTSLNLLTAILDIPTPKDDINGSDVTRVYYKEKNIDRIALYCRKDVIATAQLFLRLNSMPLIDAGCIQHV